MKVKKDDILDKPKNLSEYIKWLDSKKKDSCSQKIRSYYESTVSKARESFLESRFWDEVKRNYSVFDQEYHVKNGYKLFAEELQDIYKKPFDSVINKTYRKNVINNSKWPETEDEEGLIFPENSFCRLNDCLRTSIIVKYLDGVEFILKKLIQIADSCGIDCKHDYEAKDEGYYAVHFYICDDFEVPDMDWHTKTIKMKIEIQITTQIQDTIKKLTHKYYENRRIETNKKDVKWQWDYQNDAFIVNYMGHMLHYLEGMIMEIRDKEGK